MEDETKRTRRRVLKALTAAGALAGTTGVAGANEYVGRFLPTTSGESSGGPSTSGTGFVLGTDRSPQEQTLEWGGQGSENAALDCPDGSGYWHWILTPGGPTPLEEEGATLTVTYENGPNSVVEGSFRGGGGRGALHFDVYRSGGGTVESATVEFSGGGENALLTISDSECVEEPPGNGEPPAFELDYWQVDFGEGANPPIPPRYWPNDGMWGLGNADDGVTQNPSGIRRETVGQLADVDIVGKEFQFDDSGDPEEVTVEFEIAEGGGTRFLHLALFSLPGPFDPDEIEEQELVDAVSDEFDGGEAGSLTLPFP